MPGTRLFSEGHESTARKAGSFLSLDKLGLRFSQSLSVGPLCFSLSEGEDESQ